MVNCTSGDLCAFAYDSHYLEPIDYVCVTLSRRSRVTAEPVEHFVRTHLKRRGDEYDSGMYTRLKKKKAIYHVANWMVAKVAEEMGDGR